MTERSILTANLLDNITLSDQTNHLVFKVEGQPKFTFNAGQFISMLHEFEGKSLTRAYSLASAPREGGSFDICLNRVDEGPFSNYLCDLKVGSQVQFHGPHGYFVLKQPIRDSIFVATGTGIAPMRAMLQHLWAHPEIYRDRQFYLVFGTRYQQDLYYDAEFREMASLHSNFHYIPTLSRDNPGWGGVNGYVQKHVREIAEGRTDMDAYICGLADMVKANRDQLKELGWDRKSILYERYD